MIEAVFEDASLKESVFAEVEKVVDADCLLCSNTSTLPITELQGTVSRPHDFIGLHFFSPVHKMQLVEIIRGAHTSDEADARAIDLVQQFRKIPIVVGDGRGFFTSRVFSALVLEGVALLGEGVDPESIEQLAFQAGFPGAPLAMTDEISMTLFQHIRTEAQRAADAAGAERAVHPAEPIIDRMVESGRPGRAGGAGFYDYPDDGPKVLWPELRSTFASQPGTEATRSPVLPASEIQDRYLFAMAIDTARCFEEGVLRDAASANVGSIFGIGFPPLTGGVATFMTNRDGGLASFVARANELADAYGERFRPSPWLRAKADAGEGF